MQSLTLQSLSSFSWKNSCCYFSKLWNVNTPPDNWKCIGILVLAALGWWKKPGYEDKSTRVHENHTTYQAMAQWRKFFLFSLLHKFHSLIKKKRSNGSMPQDYSVIAYQVYPQRHGSTAVENFFFAGRVIPHATWTLLLGTAPAKEQ